MAATVETVAETAAKLRHLWQKHYWWRQRLKRQWSWRQQKQIQRWLRWGQATINKTVTAVLTVVAVNNQQNGGSSVDGKTGDDDGSAEGGGDDCGSSGGGDDRDGKLEWPPPLSSTKVLS